jgi:hypothetical protein
MPKPPSPSRSTKSRSAKSRSAKSRSGRLHARDAGLRRVSVVTRGAIAVSVAAAAGFTAVAAAAQPGHSKTANPSRSLGAGGATSATVPPATLPATSEPLGSPQTTPTTLAPAGNDGINAGDGLAPPDTVPDPGYSYSPPVVSGAS